MAEDVLARRRQRRQRRRRRAIVAATVGVVVVGGAGTAWALTGSDGPTYRVAAVRLATVEQTVDADGALSARHTAALSFATAGTVDSVAVSVGDKVTAGQTVATLDPTQLDAAVTSASAALAQAKQKLADDQEAQSTGATVSATGSSGGAGNGSGGSTSASGTTAAGASAASGASGASASTAGAVRLISSRTSTAPAAPASGSSSISTKQAAVVAAQHSLDQAVSGQDTAVRTLLTECAAADETAPSTAAVVAGADGVVSGGVGSAPSVVTLRTTSGDLATTTSANPQRSAGAGTYTFAGLTPGLGYRVEFVRTAAIDTDRCLAAVSSVSTAQHGVDAAATRLDTALTALTRAVAALTTSSGGSSSGGGSSGGSGSSGSGSSGSGSSGSSSGAGGTSGQPASGTRSGSTSGSQASSQSSTGGTGGSTSAGQSASSGSSQSGSSSGSSSTGGVAVTAEMIAADTKTIDARTAALAVAQHDRTYARLTSSLSGTVAAVTVTKGDAVSAASTTSTITVVGSGTLSVVVDIGLATIDLVKVGQPVAVTVDGRTAPVSGHVAFVGTTNAASSTGSASAYPVTVALDAVHPSLYDGMGASLAISVGRAAGVLTVPTSAVHTIGSRHSVEVDDAGTVTTRVVTTGLVGDDVVQIRSGLTAGQHVVLADLSAAVPSATTTTTRGGAFTGLTGAGAGGGFVPGGRPGR